MSTRLRYDPPFVGFVGPCGVISMQCSNSPAILCLQCAHVYQTDAGETLECSECGMTMLRYQYEKLIQYSREAAGFGHIYRTMYEAAKKQGDRNTRAQIQLHDAWAFAALAVLSGIIGNASFETVKLVIRKLLAAFKEETTNAKRRSFAALQDDAEISRFLANLTDFTSGMKEIDPWVKNVIVEEMIADQGCMLIGYGEEQKKLPNEDQPRWVTKDEVIALIKQIIDSATITEKPKEEDLNGLWQMIVQPGPPMVALTGEGKPKRTRSKAAAPSDKKVPKTASGKKASSKPSRKTAQAEGEKN
jgi:hypothetical protein